MTNDTTGIATEAQRGVGRHCPECGYDLRATTGGRCPECGLTLDGSEGSPVPWAHRRRLGRWLAFRRTVALAWLRPRRLAAAAAWPLDGRAANLFRLAAVGVGAAALTAVVFNLSAAVGGTAWADLVRVDRYVTWAGAMPSEPPTDLAMLWSAGATRWAVVPVAMAATLWAWTGLAGWVVGRGGPGGERRGRVVGWYPAAAPLALLPGPAVVAAVATWLRVRDDVDRWPVYPVFNAVTLVACGSLAWVTWAAWWAPVRAAHAAGHGRIGPAVASAAGLAAALLGAVVVGLGVLPCVAGLVWIMVDSLRP